MSNTNMNRIQSITRSQRDPAAVHDVDADLVYESGGIRLTLSLEVTRDFSTLKSRENLMQKLVEEWSAFLKLLKDEKLISDSSSNEITGVQASIKQGIVNGPQSIDAFGLWEVAFPRAG